MLDKELLQSVLQKNAYTPPTPAMPPMDPMGGTGMPPMDPSMMGGTGMPPMPPMPPAPPMDPSMMGAPPMDPSMMGAPPMDPSMMPPMDPSMMGAPPMDPAAGGISEMGAMTPIVLAKEDLDALLQAAAGEKSSSSGRATNKQIIARVEGIEKSIAALAQGLGIPLPENPAAMATEEVPEPLPPEVEGELPGAAPAPLEGTTAIPQSAGGSLSEVLQQF